MAESKDIAPPVGADDYPDADLKVIKLFQIYL